MTSAELKKFAQRKGFSRRELADFFEVSERTLYYWLSGKVKIPKWVDRLAFY